MGNPFAGGRVVASPYARRLAADAGVDISQATGSGPGGRIVAQDVQQLIDSGGGEAAAAEGSAPSGVTDVSARAHSPTILAYPVLGTGGAAAWQERQRQGPCCKALGASEMLGVPDFLKGALTSCSARSKAQDYHAIMSR